MAAPTENHQIFHGVGFAPKVKRLDVMALIAEFPAGGTGPVIPRQDFTPHTPPTPPV